MSNLLSSDADVYKNAKLKFWNEPLQRAHETASLIHGQIKQAVIKVG